MANALGFGTPIAGNAMTAEDFTQSAMTQPISTMEAFQSKGSIAMMESPIIGNILLANKLNPISRGAGVTFFGNQLKDMESDDSLRQRGLTPMTRQEFDAADPLPGMEYDPRMTVQRFNAVKNYQLHKAAMEQRIERSSHPIASFLGSLAGGGVDPVNWVPILGPEIRAAAAARWGIARGLTGELGMNAADAALNSAAATMATASFRNSVGDRTTWADVVSQGAMGALAGAAIGGALHVGGSAFDRIMGRVHGNRGLNSIENVAGSRSVLDEAVDGMVNDDAVGFSPAAEGVIRRFHQDASSSGAFDEPKPPVAAETAFAENARVPVQQWAPESVARTADGSLVPVYHGTFAKFDKFEREKLGGETGSGSAKEGFFFTENKDVAAGYAKDDLYENNAFFRALNKVTLGGYKYLNESLTKLIGKSAIKEGRVLTAHLDVKNPLVVDYGGRDINEAEVAGILRKAKDSGYDSVQFKQISDPGYTDASAAVADNWVVFSPDQIKIVDHGDPALNAKMNEIASGPAPRVSAPQAGQAAGNVAPKSPRDVPPTFTRPQIEPSSPRYTGPEDPEVTAAGRAAERVSTLETMAHDYGVDVTRDNASIEAKQVADEGRLSEADKLALAEANDAMSKAEAWSEALKAAATCVLKV